MTDNLEKRINSMFNGDRLWAYAFVVGLWLAYAFVYLAIDEINANSSIKMALIIGGALVVLYNTASITAMIVHYKEDKHDIYGIDIQHLDEMRARKSDATK